MPSTYQRLVHPYGPRRRMMGDPGISLGGLGRFVGKVARGVPGLGTVLTAASLIPSKIRSGIAQNIARNAGRLVGRVPQTSAIVPYGPVMPQLAKVTGGRLGSLKLAGAAAAGAGTALALGPSGSGSTAPSPVEMLLGRHHSGRKRYRRMNVCNMRALTRACRRVKRFEKLARGCVTLSSHVRVKKGSRGRKC